MLFHSDTYMLGVGAHDIVTLKFLVDHGLFAFGRGVEVITGPKSVVSSKLEVRL